MILCVICYYIYSIITINTTQTNDINDNKTSITTNNDTINKKINELEDKIKSNEDKINKLEKFENVKLENVMNFIINNKDTIIKNTNSMRGKDAAEFRIALDEIESNWENIFIALTKEDDEFRQRLIDYKADKIIESKN